MSSEAVPEPRGSGNRTASSSRTNSPVNETESVSILHENAQDMFEKLSAYLSAEMDASSNEYQLLEKLNNLVVVTSIDPFMHTLAFVPF